MKKTTSRRESVAGENQRQTAGIWPVQYNTAENLIIRDL